MQKWGKKREIRSKKKKEEKQGAEKKNKKPTQLIP